MDTFICPKGHQSSEADYCSECGAKMSGAAASAASAGVSGTGQICPDCRTPREDAGIAFCEICGYNFVTGAHGEVPVTPPVAPLPAVMPATQPAAVASVQAPSNSNTASSNTAAKWTAVLSVDASLREAGSPEPPANVGPFTFELTKDVTLIGRRSEARAIFPEIPMFFDDAVSHRHALLELTPEGALMVRDIGSSNGTRLNGKELPAMVDTPLADGDLITLGHWSRIAIKVGA